MKTFAVSRAALFLLVAGAGCTLHDSDVTVESVLAADAPNQESWNTDMRVSEMGVPRIHMKAGYMARYETPDSTWMVLAALDSTDAQVEAILYDDDGAPSAVVRADQVVWFEAEKRFTARGRVTVTTSENRTLWSEHLDWFERTQRVSTPGFATIQTPSRTLRGWGLNADENLGDLSLTRVSGTVLPEDEGE